MQYFKLALPLALVSSAFANPLLRRDACTSDACIAAVTGKAALGDDSLRADHCKSFLATTVTPEAITETTTITGVEPETTAWGPWKREKVTVCPNEVPNYASACETAAYSSACSCFGYSGDITTTLAPTTTTKTVYVSATGVCTGGTATKTVTVTVPSGGFTTVSGVFTSTVYQTSSVCPTVPGFSSSTSSGSSSTYTTTSAVTTTVTTTASGTTCPTTSATTSTVTVSGTTTVTVSGTTSVVTTTASASTCPTTTATTSTVTVSGSTSTSTVTTTASGSSCPTTSATTSTVTVSGSTSTSTVTTTASASSCPTLSTTTVTTTQTTTSTTTTSSSAAQPTCLTQDQADSFVSAFTNFLENTVAGYNAGLSQTYDYALAAATFDPDFQDYSDSINYMANFPLGGVTFDGVDNFNYGQGVLQYPVYVISQQTWLSCKSFTWKYNLITGLGENRPISGINVFEVSDDLSQIVTNYAEFDNAAWLQNIAEAQAAQAAAAAAAAASTTTTTTTTDAATSTTAATTTTSPPTQRKRY